MPAPSKEMSHMKRELVFLMMQFLDENNFTETMHQLELESGLYFNMKYIEEEILNGNWDRVEKYLCGFMKVDDNEYSRKIFYEIRKLKYLEALDKVDKTEAVDILNKDLKVFASSHKYLFQELAQLLTLENFRKHECLCTYKDTKSERANLFVRLERLIEATPLLRDKLQFPILKEAWCDLMLNLRVKNEETQPQHFVVPKREVVSPTHDIGVVTQEAGRVDGVRTLPPNVSPASWPLRDFSRRYTRRRMPPDRYSPS